MNDAQKTIAGALLAGASLITGNAALITVAGGIGVNWASDGLQGIRRQWQARKLDTPLARAYSAAIHAAIEGLRSAYVRTQDGRSPTTAFGLVAACADDLANAEFPAVHMSVEAAQSQLAGGLDQLLFGHDARQADFLKARLLPTTAIALRDALAADQAELSAQFEQAAEVLAHFGDAQLALTGLQVGFSLLTDTTSRIDARTLRIENTLNEVAENVRAIRAAGSPSAGPVFNNQGMQVGGSVYQAQQMNFTNAGGGSSGTPPRSHPTPPAPHRLTRLPCAAG